MVRKGSILFVTVETPLHAGTGAELGIVDLPIQREKHTGWPKVEASGLKGAIREAIPLEENIKSAIFGPEKLEKGELHSGALIFTDLRILLFPVKSAKGTFAWVISPEVFARFKRDLSALAGMDSSFNSILKELPDKVEANRVHKNSSLTVEVDGNHTILLEEYSFGVTKGDKNLESFTEWLQKYVFKEKDPRHEDLPHKICVVKNDVFNDFVKMHTEVITRTKIDPKTGTVDKTTGGLWNEEYLPVETVMYNLMLATPIMKKDNKPEDLKSDNSEQEAANVLNKIKEHLPSFIFLGGNETIGKGLVSLKVLNAGG